MNPSDNEKMELENEIQGATKESVLTLIRGKACRLKGLSLPIKFCDDKDVVLAAVEYIGQEMFRYASKELQNDRDFVISAVTCCKWVLYMVAPKFQDDFDVVSAAMLSTELSSRHIAALGAASPRLRSNRNIVLKAVESYGLEIGYANPCFLDDEEIIFTAFENRRDDGSQYYGKPHGIYAYISTRLRKKIEKIGEKIIEKKSTSLTDKIAEASDKAAEKLGDMITYFSDDEKKERELMKEQELLWQKENRDHKERWKQDIEEWKNKLRQWQENQKYEHYIKFRSKIEHMPLYERWKQDVLKKCGEKCQLDKSHVDRHTEVHHIDSLYSIYIKNNLISNEEIIKCKKLWDIDNGIVLCKECHDTMESSKKRQSLMTNTSKEI